MFWSCCCAEALCRDPSQCSHKHLSQKLGARRDVRQDVHRHLRAQVPGSHGPAPAQPAGARVHVPPHLRGVGPFTTPPPAHSAWCLHACIMVLAAPPWLLGSASHLQPHWQQQRQPGNAIPHVGGGGGVKTCTVEVTCCAGPLWRFCFHRNEGNAHAGRARCRRCSPAASQQPWRPPQVCFVPFTGNRAPMLHAAHAALLQHALLVLVHVPP